MQRRQRYLQIEHLEARTLLTCNFNGDDSANAIDIDYLTERLGTNATEVDLNSDGRVDLRDRSALIEIGLEVM